jgi:hypothetical protein
MADILLEKQVKESPTIRATSSATASQHRDQREGKGTSLLLFNISDFL